MKTEQILQWLQDPRCLAALGRTGAVRLDVMARLSGSNDSLSDIARRHGISRQAVARHDLHVRLTLGLV